MFCLRSWLPVLVFLSSCPPIYIALFLFAHYSLQRPCVYCSILLFVLIFSLFDFRANWFEPRWHPLSSEQYLSASETLSSFITGNATVGDAVLETAGLVVAAVNGTGGGVAGAVVEGVRRRVGVGGGSGSAGVFVGGGMGSGFEALRSALEKFQVRIPCLDVVVRL